MQINPYSLNFGQEPIQFIPRNAQTQEVEQSFLLGTQQSYVITGIRGCGKTVFLTNVCSKCKENNWIVVNINLSNRDSALRQMLVKLAGESRLKKFPDFESLSLSVLGFGVQIGKKEFIKNDENDVTKLLETAKKHNQKVLIAIDEVINSNSMKELISAFQIWTRDKLPVYLIMTGLYENIKELQNSKALTFLYRCPRIDLVPLEKSAIKENYQRNLKITEEQAIEMAKYTKGYSFAFQALGYSVFLENEFNEDAINRCKTILFDYSYMKIWDELSNNDRKVCVALAQSNNGSYAEIKDILNWNNNQLNPYRRRLINKQIVESKRKGEMNFSLPFFQDFVMDLIEFDEVY